MFQFLKMLRLKRHRFAKQLQIKPLLSQRARPQSPFYPNQIGGFVFAELLLGREKKENFQATADRMSQHHTESACRIMCSPSLFNKYRWACCCCCCVTSARIKPANIWAALNHGASCQGSWVGPSRGCFWHRVESQRTVVVRGC